MFDGKAFGQEIVGAVKAYLEREVSSISARLEALEKRIDELPRPRDGKDADMTEVRAIVALEVGELKSAIEAIGPARELPDIAAMVTEAVATIPAPENGKDGSSVTIDDVAPLIAAEVEKRVSEIPRPKDGQDGTNGKDGESIDPVEVERMVSEQVEKAVASIPVPKDGSDGKDGVGLASALIDRDGNLVITMTNGEAKPLGVVIGKDGTAGADGKDGRDGFSLEEFDAELMPDGRTVLLSFGRGDQSFKVELGIPAMIYRGVFTEGETYERGDTVTWAGSLWHCDEGTTDKPGDGKSWTLAVKRGRDGKPGKDGNPPAPPSPVKL